MQLFVKKQREELERKKAELEKRRKRKVARKLRVIANRSAARIIQRCADRFLIKIRRVRAALHRFQFKTKFKFPDSDLNFLPKLKNLTDVSSDHIIYDIVYATTVNSKERIQNFEVFRISF